MGKIIGLIPKAEKPAPVKAAPVPEVSGTAAAPEESKPKKKSK